MVFHTNQKKGSSTPYNSTNTPGGAGCIIDEGQEHHNDVMSKITEGVNNVSEIKVFIISLTNQNKAIEERNAQNFGPTGVPTMGNNTENKGKENINVHTPTCH